MLHIILFSAIAGICGTGLGGLVTAIMLKRSSETMTCWMLSFAAGVMTSIVCFGLVPEAFTLAGIIVSLSGLVLGIVIIMGLSRIVDAITETKGEELKVHHTHEELYHERQIIHDRTRMLRSGMLMLMAIGLHNIPEAWLSGQAAVMTFIWGCFWR